MAVNNVIDVLDQWNIAGMDYVLAFLLVFAVIFGVLSATNILGKHKGVHVIIALVIAIMSLRGGMAVGFFNQAFPRVAVAIAVILSLVILTAVFVPKEHWSGWSIGLYSVGALAFLFVIFNSFSDLEWFGSNWWTEWGGLLLGGLLIIGVIIAVSVTGGDKEDKKEPTHVSFEPRYR